MSFITMSWRLVQGVIPPFALWLLGLAPADPRVSEVSAGRHCLLVLQSRQTDGQFYEVTRQHVALKDSHFNAVMASINETPCHFTKQRLFALGGKRKSIDFNKLSYSDGQSLECLPHYSLGLRGGVPGLEYLWVLFSSSMAPPPSSGRRGHETLSC